jgi:hypothetical protein
MKIPSKFISRSGGCLCELTAPWRDADGNEHPAGAQYHVLMTYLSNGLGWVSEVAIVGGNGHVVMPHVAIH